MNVEMESAPRQIVFLHSMWRARSTWLLGRFRAAGEFHCYSEPLNEDLAKLDARAIEEAAQPDSPGRDGMHHPNLAGGQWREYESRLSSAGVGVEGFDSRFAFHRFDAENDPGSYLRKLVEESPRRKILFKLCRSPFRLVYLVALFPDAQHYYLARDAEKQFVSYAVRPKYFLPAHLAYAYLQPTLRREIDDRFRTLRPLFLRKWRIGDDARLLRRYFSKQLARSEGTLRRAVFDFLHAAARDDAERAGLEIVDVDDSAMIRSVFGTFGLSFEDYSLEHHVGPTSPRKGE